MSSNKTQSLTELVSETNPSLDKPNYYFRWLLLLVTQPNLNEFVFVRLRVSSENFEILDGIEVTLLENQVYFLPYDCIK